MSCFVLSVREPNERSALWDCSASFFARKEFDLPDRIAI
jgi:hypothetical protein